MTQDVLKRSRLEDASWMCEELGEWPKECGKEAEDQRWREAYEYAVLWSQEEPFSIDEEHLLTLYHKLTGRTDGYRTCKVSVRGSPASRPKPEDVPELMEDYYSLCRRFLDSSDDPIACASFAHLLLTRIHPFQNWNGRIARLLMNAVLLHWGRNAVFVTGEIRKDYLLAVMEYDRSGDPVPFQRFLAEVTQDGV